jgi:hypothetical protein
MMITSRPTGFPWPSIQAQPFRGMVPNTTSPRFGRDALFERNARFEAPLKRNHSAPNLLKTLKRKLNILFSPKAPAKPVKDSLYNEQGRIRGKAVLKAALEQATTDYDASKKPGVSPQTQALAGIRLANAMLAADTDNPGAFLLLDNALKTLHDNGFPTNSEQGAGNIPPEYVHGLYNRGCYVLNNDLYRYMTEKIGPEEIVYNDAAHEGMVVAVPPDKNLKEKLQSGLQEGLPYLKQAIELAKAIPDRNIALVEYLSAQGEVLHALSHLYDETPKIKKPMTSKG